MRANLPAITALLLGTTCLAFSGCKVTRPEVEAYIYLNNGVPADVCEREPALKDHGFYRRLNDGRLEFISFCDPEAQNWVSMFKLDYERLLDKAFPKPQGVQ